MSELKAHNINDLSLHDIANCDFYINSEADKVIAELEEKHKTEVKELLYLIRDKENDFNLAFDCEEKEARHQKYKRCLAMAKYCDMGLTCYNEKLDRFSCERANFFYRWYNRWLELAEKFKEAK